jgi:hypothetical protein
MSRQLTIELSDRLYGLIEQQAQAAGSTPSRVAAESLQRQFADVGAFLRDDIRTTEDVHAAREAFERLIGSCDLGHPLGTDNEQIDADLARAYAETHGAS